MKEERTAQSECWTLTGDKAKKKKATTTVISIAVSINYGFATIICDRFPFDATAALTLCTEKSAEESKTLLALKAK